VAVRCLQDATWSTQEARVGTSVTVETTATGFDDGTPATVEVEKQPLEGGARATVEAIETTVQGEAVAATWTYERTPDADGSGSGVDPGASGGASGAMPAYVATVRVEGHPRPATTGLLTYADTLVVRLTRPDGEGLSRHPYRLRLSTGAIRSGTTDADGWLEEDDVPPGGFDFLR
jgi:hypothetical protein